MQVDFAGGLPRRVPEKRLYCAQRVAPHPAASCPAGELSKCKCSVMVLKNEVRAPLQEVPLAHRAKRAGPHSSFYCTVKTPGPVAVPPGALRVTLPVTAPAPTVAVTCVSELTVNAAFTLPMVTLLVCFRLMPVIVTCVPT